MTPTLIKPIERLKRAQLVFENQIVDLSTETHKLAATQAFEFCYELAWKTIKKLFESEGFPIGTPKIAFRKAASEGLISSPEIWFTFQEARNLTSHTYEQETLDEVVAVFKPFSLELDLLIKNLESRV